MQYRSFSITTDGEYIQAINNSRYGFRLKRTERGEGNVNFLKLFIDYILDDNRLILDGETSAYGLWVVKFITNGTILEVYEFDSNMENWIIGAETAITLIEEQREVCRGVNVQSDMPKIMQKIAFNTEVLSNKDVKGRRYHEPSHMSGWYIITDEFNGDIKTLNVWPLIDFVKHRKDLVKFLALPEGMSFETEGENNYVMRAE